MTDYTPSTSIQDDVLSFLMTSPSPDDIIAFHASDVAQHRLQYLLDANRDGTLSDDERAELEEASQMNHFVMLLKARAHQTKKNTQSDE
ncbi:MAG: hypothetical protein AAFQ07_01185 [Chloroflexota bacterium]